MGNGGACGTKMSAAVIVAMPSGYAHPWDSWRSAWFDSAVTGMHVGMTSHSVRNAAWDISPTAPPNRQIWKRPSRPSTCFVQAGKRIMSQILREEEHGVSRVVYPCSFVPALLGYIYSRPRQLSYVAAICAREPFVSILLSSES